ncbi:hypothetical protein CLIM01_11649 [Colletotrichum limetticola]|uniref:C2H2-type domain-containing protein n=1 Tax=Colletotrichum limetticola TaxID=1209924 RepID=A0ABQ9PHE9_9PEZI|nr:hypothetical protein CLIM01_11649 [Colletotrichum limetticola]
MSAADSKTKSRCEVFGCENRTYSSPSNLKRHVKANHNQAVQVSCGKCFPNHLPKIKRHKDACGCVVLVEPLIPDVGHGVGTPGMSTTANTTTMPTFDVTHVMLDNCNNEYYPVGSISFGPL